jgi:uncharacterized surface protein with fasciclin (FAS1) repeats
MESYKSLKDFPKPIVPWIGKSLMDVLVETSKHCKGDLSGFIALIKDIPSLFAKLQLQQEGTTAATTLFVPTNDALVSFDPTLMAVRQQGQDFNTTIIQLLQNHFVSGNFASQCWWTIPTGTKINYAELKLKSDAGQLLYVIVNDTITINGNVIIVQKDVFSEDGILLIIDKVLILM